MSNLYGPPRRLSVVAITAAIAACYGYSSASLAQTANELMQQPASATGVANNNATSNAANAVGNEANKQARTTNNVELAPVTITAAPLTRGEVDLQPASVLRGNALRQRESTSLGDTTARELGVQSSAYGPGAGRPIIRGMDGGRVRINESGLDVADVSSASPDHRVAADSFNSRQIEVLRGPATLLYGSGAAGGLVNIVSDRIPRQPSEQWEADVNLRAGRGQNERLGAIGLQGALGSGSESESKAAWRLEGFKQKSGDYRLAAPLRDENGEVYANDRLPNSDTNTQSLSLGAAWFGGNAARRDDKAPDQNAVNGDALNQDVLNRLGAAVQRYESDYGIPNPEEPVTLRLRRTRVEAVGDVSSAIGPFTALRLRAAATDYRHTEFEPSGEAGARFTRRGSEARLEAPHQPWAGFEGVLGAQLSQSKVQGLGEGVLPETQTQALALFTLQRKRMQPLTLEWGLRAESERLAVQQDTPEDQGGGRKPTRSFGLWSASGGATHQLSAHWALGAALTVSQRAPSAEELYYEGAHPATFAYEVGNSGLRKEHSTNFELSLKAGAEQGPRGRVNVFMNRVRDYIYGYFDGSTTALLDENGVVEEELSTLQYRQDDAQFYGAEAEFLSGQVRGPQLRLWGDLVRASLQSGINKGAPLPRIAPARFGVDLGWKEDAWQLEALITRAQRQTRTAPFDLRDGAAEQATAGYTRLDAHASWRMPSQPLTFYVQGRNLNNVDARLHTSFLKNFAPLPGRSFWLGVRGTF